MSRMNKKSGTTVMSNPIAAPTNGAATGPSMPRLNGTTPQGSFQAPGATPRTSDGLPTSQTAPRSSLTQDDIARAAYFRWQQRGGDSFTNWVEAERELRSRS
jgi:hypothetical protein